MKSLSVGDWTFELLIGLDSPKAASLTAEVQATLDYIAEHQADLRAALLQAAKAEYDKALQDKDAFDPEDLPDILPPIKNDQDLLRLITPRDANVFATAAQGLHFVGFMFACTWDEEHGIGMLTHGGAVLRHGGGDTAVLEWMAEEAARKLG